jgi:DNA-binding transcriptional regulator YdaS (Cro superfamily)
MKPKFNSLRNYLSTLSTDRQISFANSCGTSIGYLRKVLSTEPTMDGALCRLLDEKSNGQVKKHELRPDIWPELAKAA